jgi:hypothetical protein
LQGNGLFVFHRLERYIAFNCIHAVGFGPASEQTASRIESVPFYHWQHNIFASPPCDTGFLAQIILRTTSLVSMSWMGNKTSDQGHKHGHDAWLKFTLGL